MRRLLPLAASLAAVLLLGGLRPAYAEDDASPTRRPNIVLMLSDDQAWNGTSVAMHPTLAYAQSPTIQTPNLERLAAAGMRFSSAYAPAPMCSPTRVALQTGRSAAAVHFTTPGHSVTASAGYKLVGPRVKRAIATADVTVAEALRDAGYTTAHFGKWHIHGGGPGPHGYDVHDGDLGNEYAAQYADPNPVDIFGMTDRTAAFMAKAKKAQKPFFVQLSWHALHAPQNALAATKAKYAKLLGAATDDRRVMRAAIAEDLDTGVGRVMKALDDLDLAKNTYVIYMADNGAGGGGRAGGRGRRGGGRAAGLSGGKGSLGEGGIRAPFVIRGPGIAAGAWNHTPISGIDLYPTFAAWAGVRRLPKTLEGGDLGPLLRGAKDARVERARPGLTFHFPHYQGSNTPQSAIRVGPLKLILSYEDERVVLYDLDADPREQTDLAAKRPEDAKALRALLDAWLQAVGAGLPTKNASYDPENPPAPRARGGRRGKGGGKQGKGRRRPRDDGQ